MSVSTIQHDIHSVYWFKKELVNVYVWVWMQCLDATKGTWVFNTEIGIKHYRLLVPGNVYFCQAMCTCARQCVLVPGNLHLCQAKCPCARQCVLLSGNVYLCQAINTCDRQFAPGNLYLCQAICTCARQFVLVTSNLYLCQAICTCDKQFVLVPGNLYLSTHINLLYAQIDICPRVFLIFKQCRNREPDSLN